MHPKNIKGYTVTVFNVEFLKMLDSISINIKRSFIDLLKFVKGFFAIISFVITKDRINLGLSYFYTSSQIVKQGHNCTYEIGICNITGKKEWVRMLFDIHLKENPEHPSGHYGYFEKAIFVRARESQRVDIVFNWKDYAVINVDNVSLEPDIFWIGGSESLGKYILRVHLLDDTGEVFDELTLIQKMSNENC